MSCAESNTQTALRPHSLYPRRTRPSMRSTPPSRSVALSVLVVEPDADRYQQMQDAFDATLVSADVVRVGSLDEALAHLRDEAIDVCLAPSERGPDLTAALTLRLARAAAFVPVIALVDSLEAGIEALNDEGAADFILRDRLDGAELARALLVSQTRKEAVAAFRHEREVRSAALREADVVVAELDRTGCFARLSAHAYDLVGMEPEGLLGQPFTSLLGESERSRLAALLGGEGREGLPLRLRQSPAIALGSLVEWVLSPLSVGGAVAVGRLLSSPSEDEALRLLEHITGLLPVAVFASDMEGRFTFAAGASLDHFGLPAERLVGTSAFDLFADAADRLALVEGALAGEAADVTIQVEEATFDARFLPLYNQADMLEGMMMVAYHVGVPTSELQHGAYTEQHSENTK